MKLIENFFNTSNIVEIFINNNIELLKRSKEKMNIKNKISIKELISKIYNRNKSSYRNEYIYKNELMNKRLLGRYSLNTTYAMSEVVVCDSKPDLVILNGKDVVYEIKSDRDNFSRLIGQINDYYKVFKYVNVIINNKELEKAINSLPHYVGIEIMNNKNRFTKYRDAIINTKMLKIENIFATLRKKERESLVKKIYKKDIITNDFNYYTKFLEVLKSFEVEHVQLEAIKILKKRKDLIKYQDYLKELPYELFTKGYFLNKNKYSKLNLNILKEII